jgi:hypothetical protein
MMMKLSPRFMRSLTSYITKLSNDYHELVTASRYDDFERW